MLSDVLQFTLEATLAIKLRDTFQFPTHKIGIFFFYFLGGTLISTILLLLVPENWEKRYFIIVGNLIMLFAPLLIGPSEVLSFPEDATLVAVGLFIGGLGRS